MTPLPRFNISLMHRQFAVKLEFSYTDMHDYEFLCEQYCVTMQSAVLRTNLVFILACTQLYCYCVMYMFLSCVFYTAAYCVIWNKYNIFRETGGHAYFWPTLYINAERCCHANVQLRGADRNSFITGNL